MKIDVAKLADGQEIIFREAWDPKTFEIDVPGMEYKAALDVEAIASRDSGIIKVKVLLRSVLCLTCSRCFRDFESPLDQTFDLVYSIDLSERTIELDEDIRAELILSYPQKILCREDCLGLCARCGVDLNEGACMCKRNVSD
ncbi:MAG: DUF177 domain-containing protein [Candidatus Omnitrophica bacterium]|nr:DUF177 domain-containing protein [Candidatus Omnitrophota bacterium]